MPRNDDKGSHCEPKVWQSREKQNSKGKMTGQSLKMKIFLPFEV